MKNNQFSVIHDINLDKSTIFYVVYESMNECQLTGKLPA